MQFCKYPSAHNLQRLRASFDPIADDKGGNAERVIGVQMGDKEARELGKIKGGQPHRPCIHLALERAAAAVGKIGLIVHNQCEG